MSDRHALIIEDEDKLSNIFSAALKTVGFSVEAILNGREAQESLKTRADIPDLIVLDLHLPHVPGNELLAQIRADERFADTRVMLVTADPILGQSVRESADLLLIKPASIIQIQKLAQRLVGG